MEEGLAAIFIRLPLIRLPSSPEVRVNRLEVV